ncbi:MAG: hypothetical protein ACO28Q_02865 [Ilumatobacteraceae bacterium]
MRRVVATGWAASVAVTILLSASPPGSVNAEITEGIGALVSQDQYVAGIEGSIIDLSVILQGPSALGTDAPTSILVTAHRPVTTRAAVQSAIDGDLPSTIDSLRFPVEQRDASGVIDLAIPIEIGTRTRERMQMSAAGLYPLSIAVEVDGNSVDRIITFVERLPDGLDSPAVEQSLPVALVGSVDGEVTLQADSTTTVRAADRSRVAELATIIESLPGTPLTIAVRPELVEGLGRSTVEDAELLARMQFADAPSYLSMPYVQVDPGSLADSQTNDIFIGQLRLGEDALADALPESRSSRTAWIQTRELSATGAQFIRDLGFRSILITPAAAEVGDFGGLAFADSTRKVEVELASGGFIDAVIPDAALASRLTAASDSPPSDAYLAAQHVLAEIKAIRRELDDAGESLSGRSLILATNDGALMSTDLTVALADTLSSSNEVELVTLDDALSRTSVALVDGRPASIRLPATGPVASSSPAEALYLTGARIDAFASMLPDGDERPAMWRRILDVLPDQRFSEEARFAYADVVRQETEALASQVVTPASTTFTLGGRDSAIRLSLRNDSPTELAVRVRLASSKLRFPEGELVVQLAPSAITSVEIPVEARSNGRFPVTVQLLTPEGQLPLTQPIVFTARVNALAGLGQLVTVMAFLLLAVWWIHHLRQRYRERQSQVTDTTHRHPSGDVARHPPDEATN